MTHLHKLVFVEDVMLLPLEDKVGGGGGGSGGSGGGGGSSGGSGDDDGDGDVGGGGKPPPGGLATDVGHGGDPEAIMASLIELPTCMVCLDRLDPTVSTVCFIGAKHTRARAHTHTHIPRLQHQSRAPAAFIEPAL